MGSTARGVMLIELEYEDSELRDTDDAEDRLDELDRDGSDGIERREC